MTIKKNILLSFLFLNILIARTQEMKIGLLSGEVIYSEKGSDQGSSFKIYNDKETIISSSSVRFFENEEGLFIKKNSSLNNHNYVKVLSKSRIYMCIPTRYVRKAFRDENKNWTSSREPKIRPLKYVNFENDFRVERVSYSNLKADFSHCEQCQEELRKTKKYMIKGFVFSLTGALIAIKLTRKIIFGNAASSLVIGPIGYSFIAIGIYNMTGKRKTKLDEVIKLYNTID